MFFEAILLVILLLLLYSNASSPPPNPSLTRRNSSLRRPRSSFRSENDRNRRPKSGGDRSENPPLAAMPENDRIRFINRALVDDVMTEILRVVLNFLFSGKDSHLSYKDYMIGKSSLQKKPKFKGQEQYLKKNNCEDLDVTALSAILYEGIQILVPDGKIKSKCIDSVRMVRLLRNSVMHQPKAAAIERESKDKIEEALKMLVDNVGAASGREKKETENIKKKISTDIEHQIMVTATRKKLMCATYKFRVNGRKESQRYWEQYCQRGILIDHEQVQFKEVFYPLNVKGVDEYGNENVESFEACIKAPSERKVTIVEAEAGAGKTTVMKYIGLMFYGLIEGSQIEALKSYDLLHFFECGDATSSNLREYIQNTYPEACQDIEIDDIVLSLGMLNSIFIIDAYDERNERSNRVIRELITYMKRWKTCNFIFTMRSYAISSFIQLLRKENIDFNHFHIEGLYDKNEQITFLQRLDSQHGTPDLIDSFQKLDPHLTDFFRFPVNLTYYRSLFRASPETIKQWRIDSDVLDDMYNLFTVLIENKMSNSSNDLVTRVLEEVNELALRYLLIDRVVIEKNDFEQLKTDCRNKICKNLPYDQMLSNIFTSKTSPLPVAEVKFQFQHKSVQEYFASKALVKRLLAENCDDPMTVLIELDKEEREKKGKLLAATLAQRPPLEEVYRNFLHDDIIAKKNYLGKFEKLFAFVINQLRKQTSPRKELIKNIVRLLPGEKGIALANFHYWDRLLRLCKYDETLLEIVSTQVTWDAINTSTLSDSNNNCPDLLFNHLDGELYVQELLIVVPRTITEYGNIKILLQKLVEIQYTGWLRFILEHSFEHQVPCDNIVMELRGSRSKLIEFKACLSDGKSLEVLSKVKIPMASLAIRVPAEHCLDFSPLAGTNVQLHVQVPFLSEEDGNLFKLPKTEDPVHVSINGLPPRSWHAVAQMIIAMAPDNKTFNSIEIVNGTMEDEDVNSLVLELEANGLSVDLDLKEMKWDKVKKVGQVLPCIRLYPTLQGI